MPQPPLAVIHVKLSSAGYYYTKKISHRDITSFGDIDGHAEIVILMKMGTGKARKNDPQISQMNTDWMRASRRGTAKCQLAVTVGSRQSVVNFRRQTCEQLIALAAEHQWPTA
jgi:hypothetical protein